MCCVSQVLNPQAFTLCIVALGFLILHVQQSPYQAKGFNVLEGLFLASHLLYLMASSFSLATQNVAGWNAAALFFLIVPLVPAVYCFVSVWLPAWNMNRVPDLELPRWIPQVALAIVKVAACLPRNKFLDGCNHRCKACHRLNPKPLLQAKHFQSSTHPGDTLRSGALQEKNPMWSEVSEGDFSVLVCCQRRASSLLLNYLSSGTLPGLTLQAGMRD